MSTEGERKRLYFVPNHLAENEVARINGNNGGQKAEIIGRGGSTGNVVRMENVNGHTPDEDGMIEKFIQPGEAGILVTRPLETD